MSPPTNSSRWSPTPEQLMMLEEIYRSGIKTPNAFQIQQITARLSFHGRIEPKNVFYWFQNLKARDRQKLRRKLCRQPPPQPLCLPRQLDQRSRGILRCLNPRSSVETQPLFCSSNGSLLRGVEKMEIIPGRVEMEKAVMRMYGWDWMIKKVSVGPHQHGPTKPPKTLQLFPITSSNLKDEFATSN